MGAQKEPKTTKPKAKREKATSTKGHYVLKEELLRLIKRDKENNNTLSPELAKCLWMIAEKYSYSPSFGGYSFREDMVAYAVVNLVKNWHKFDPDISDQPFAYYTQAAYRSFLQYLAIEKDQRDIRDKLLIEAGANPSFSYQERTRPASLSDDTAFMSGGGGE
jgi:DNA-directed RNA polymerase specialized sigma subunit